MKTKASVAPKRYKKAPVDPSALAQTERDFKDAILTVSVFVNLFMLCVWVVLQSSTQYDVAIANFFLDR